MATRPIVFPGYPILYGLGLLAAVGFSVGLVLAPSLLFAPGGGCGGVRPCIARRRGVPIVISLLNAFTGLAVAANYLLGNVLLATLLLQAPPARYSPA